MKRITKNKANLVFKYILEGDPFQFLISDKERTVKRFKERREVARELEGTEKGYSRIAEGYRLMINGMEREIRNLKKMRKKYFEGVFQR